jgi:undecaprenyl-diphosphatase
VAAQDTPRIEDAQRTVPSDVAESRARVPARADSHRTNLAGWLFVAVLGFGGFAVMTALIASKYVFPFDQPLLDAGARLSAYMAAWKDLSNSANFPLIAVGLAIIIGLLLFRRWKEAIVVVVLLIVVTAGSEIVKQLIARPRPPGYGESVVGVVYSFPSGHVLEALTLYGIIAVLVWRSSLPTVWRILIPAVFTAIVILVAIARVAVGSHYPSDVLASAFGGLGCVAIFAILSAILRPGRSRSAAAKIPA